MNPKMGEDIRNAVQQGIASGDFSQLNKLVNESVTETLLGNNNAKSIEEALAQGRERARKEMEQMSETWKNWNETHQGGNYSKTGSTGRVPAGQRAANESAQQRYVRTAPETTQQSTVRPGMINRKAFLFKKKGAVLSILARVFGTMGSLLFFLFCVIFISEEILAAFIVFGTLFLFNLLMVIWGAGRSKLLRRAERYVGMCGDREYVTIEDLVQSTPFDKRKIISDIEKMINIGILPQGHLDKKKTCMILSDEIYSQYLATENDRKERLAEERRAKKQQKAQNAVQEQDEENSELAQMVREGEATVQKLREMNDQIEGEVISGKLYRLEELLKEIFKKVQDYPEKMPQMHTTMSYYLPTVLKLVEAYKEFDQVSAPGPDIISAKKQIENTLDTINAAFTELLNKLFEDRVFDVTTDAQVLQTMLAREGLSNEFGQGNADSQSSAGQTVNPFAQDMRQSQVYPKDTETQQYNPFAKEGGNTFQSQLDNEYKPELVLSNGVDEQ